MSKKRNIADMPDADIEVSAYQVNQEVFPQIAAIELQQADEDLEEARKHCMEQLQKVLRPKDGTVDAIRHARDIGTLIKRLLAAMGATERISMAWSMSIKNDGAKSSTVKVKCLIPTVVNDPDLGQIVGNNVRTFEF